MQLSDLSYIELLDPRGQPVFFGELWRDQVAVVAFVRHFGCLFCFEQVADLLEKAEPIRATGARLYVVGNGTPLHARVFMEEAGLSEGVYSDPARLLYDRLGMKHGFFTTVNPTSARHARRAEARGFRQRGRRGDPWQQGGALVIDRDGTVAFLQRFSMAGERADLGDLLRAVERCKVLGRGDGATTKG
jgi:peroxiredoxin